MMFRTLEVNSQEVSYEVTSTIKVGRRYRISASQGYAGVVNGYVDVLNILRPVDIEELSGDDDVKDIIEYIESYKDAQLSLLTDRDDNPEEGYEEEKDRLDNTVWIVYHYPYGEGATEGVLAFPIEEFIDHTSLF